jgi:hypothetical protein
MLELGLWSRIGLVGEVDDVSLRLLLGTVV